MTSTTLTVPEIINGMTSNDFKAADVYIKQEIAYNTAIGLLGNIDIAFTGNLDDATFQIDDPQQAMGIAMFASAILVQGRIINRSKTSGNIIIPKTVDKLFTPEMMNMLVRGDVADEDDVAEEVMWSNDGPTEHWDMNSSFINL